MKIKNPQDRLSKFWGKVDHKHVNDIARHVRGKSVLDMGCGYGTTTAHLTAAGFECTGIDYEPSVILAARERFPHCSFREANAESLPFESNSFDTVILRDALHHFYGEANFEKVKSEIKRVARKNARLIFFDPNVNFLLKTMRKISFHKDEECNYETARAIMKELGFEIIHSNFNTVYSLPLSGGYVGINLVPGIKPLHKMILRSETAFEKLVNKMRLGRYVCWRYNIVGERTSD